MTRSRLNLPAIGVGAAALTAAALAVANFGGDGGNGGPGPYAITLVLSLAVAAALFGWAITRIDRPGRAGVIAGAVGVLSLAAFWSGLPYVLGPAAVALGLLGRSRAAERTAGTTAVVLGSLATIGGIAALIADRAL
jgi:hypothetical protein